MFDRNEKEWNVARRERYGSQDLFEGNSGRWRINIL